MLEELSDSIKKMAMGDLLEIEDAFHELHVSRPQLSFPECVDVYQTEHGVKLNNVHINHAMKGFERK